MATYWPLRDLEDVERRRTIEHLLKLREQLKKEIPSKTNDSLLLATWNIRDFDSNKFGYGLRKNESFHYIAEILNAFDLIAVQEINRDFKPFSRLMRLLGPNYDYIITDTTEGKSGNLERIAFVFDRRKVQFRKIAGEIVLPGSGNDTRPEQFARTPSVAAFQAGWFKFNLCSVHIYYGATSGEKLAKRVREIDALAKFFVKRQKSEPGDYFLLGDFNIVNDKDPTMQPLKKHGFKVPEQIKGEEIKRKGSNLTQEKYYDQIALRPSDKRLEIGASGVFNFRSSVYGPENFDTYKGDIPKEKTKGKSGDSLKKEYDKWITWQMSDHLPLWVQLHVDFTDDYLESLLPGEIALAKAE